MKNLLKQQNIYTPISAKTAAILAIHMHLNETIPIPAGCANELELIINR